MKTWKNLAFVAVVAIFCVIGFTACEDKDDDPEPTRVFTDIILSGKAMTLIDQTGASTDLKARGIWQKFHDAVNGKTFAGATLTKYTGFTDFAIVIKEGSANPSVSGHTLIFTVGFINSRTVSQIWNDIEAYIQDDM